MDSHFQKISRQNKISILLVEGIILATGIGLLVSGIMVPASIKHSTANTSEKHTASSGGDVEAADAKEQPSTGIAPRAITPHRLIIPSLHIDAPVTPVGKNRVGNMAVPEDYDTVAWYKPGYQPGEVGNAVLAGHLDDSLGRAGVFEQLGKLEIGETFSIVNKEGEELTFRVTEKNVYDYRTAPLEEIFGPSDTSSVHLISCQGEWLNELNTYRDRTVITGEFVASGDVRAEHE